MTPERRDELLAKSLLGRSVLAGFSGYHDEQARDAHGRWTEGGGAGGTAKAADDPIVHSLLDTDWYKMTMGQLVFHQFPKAQVSYKFINRGKTDFPAGFGDALRSQIDKLGTVKMKPEETAWLRKQTVLKPDYVDFLSKYRFDPKQVDIKQTGGDVTIGVHGPWAETILWEVPLMAMISEQYYRMTGKQPEPAAAERVKEKAAKLSAAGVNWIDFGTRRRFGYASQDHVDRTMSQYSGFVGTSNPHFAMKYGQQPVGTYAHESIMGMQGRVGFEKANKEWMDQWLKEYQGKLGIALTDTVTTKSFLKDFDKERASRFSGVRHDSGDPFKFGEDIIKHYKALGINPKDKTIVFSDKLDTDSAIALHKHFDGRVKTLFGIGTHLTNDAGHKPLNIVVKLSTVDFGKGPKDVVKLSDEAGKHTGTAEAIALCKKSLGITDDEPGKEPKKPTPEDYTVGRNIKDGDKIGKIVQKGKYAMWVEFPGKSMRTYKLSANLPPIQP